VSVLPSDYDDEQRHALRTGFDLDAEAYQRTRPVFPAAAFDDLVRLAGLAPGDRVAEIAPGTGQATVPLAMRGLAVTAVELGASLAELARRRLAAFPSCSVVTGAFEDWEPQEKSFGAVVVFNALHWIDPAVRYAKPAALLRPGGAMVKGSCRWARPADAHAFWTDVQQDYHAVGFGGDPPPPPEAIPALHFPAEAAGLFEETASLRYPIHVTYSAEDYLAQLGTQSGTQAMGAARAAEFLSRVRQRLESLRMPALTATFVGLLAVGRRPAGGNRRESAASRTAW
jgi:SAM-dependent methyltransferase